jgi:hypothetical protein
MLLLLCLTLLVCLPLPLFPSPPLASYRNKDGPPLLLADPTATVPPHAHMMRHIANNSNISSNSINSNINNSRPNTVASLQQRSRPRNADLKQRDNNHICKIIHAGSNNSNNSNHNDNSKKKHFAASFNKSKHPLSPFCPAHPVSSCASPTELLNTNVGPIPEHLRLDDKSNIN